MEDKIIKDTQENDEVSLKEIFSTLKMMQAYLKSKWLVLLICCSIGMFLGYLYAKFQKNIFTATTTFVLEAGENGGGIGSQYAGIASAVGLDVGGGGGLFQGDNILELYKSRAMIEKALLSETIYHNKKQLIIDRYVDFNDLREKWDKNERLKNIQFSAVPKQDSASRRLQDSILGVVVIDINRNYLDVDKPDKKLNLIKVTVKAPDESFAKIFNDQIVENVNNFYVQTKTKKSLQNVSILAKKVDSVRSALSGAIYSSAEIADATPNLNPTRQIQRVAPMQRSQFNAETNKSILGELVKNLELSKISLLKETPLIQVIDEPIFPLSVQHFGKAKGIVLGGLIAGFLTTLILLIRRKIAQIVD